LLFTIGYIGKILQVQTIKIEMIFLITYSLIPAIFLISKKSLIEKKSFLVILSFCTILSIYGVAFIIINQNYKYLDFLCPLYSLVNYRILLFIFYSITKKYPNLPSRDFPASNEEIANRFFFIAFMFFCIIVPHQITVNLR
jgi:hypothetical protein